MISEAQRFWDAIAGKVKQAAQDVAQNTFRCERYEVTTAPNGYKMGVTLPLGTKEIFLPYSSEVSGATVGSQVLVVWWGSMSNAKVYYYANGYEGSSAKSVLEAWPIGAIYESTVNTSPAALFGGDWLPLDDGRVLIGANSTYAAGSTGGDATITLTTNQIPAHTHGSKSLTGYTGVRRYGSSSAGNNTIGIQGTSGIVSVGTATWSGEHGQLGFAGNYTNTTVDRLNINATHEHTSVGGGQAHSNMQPYLSVYRWKRIA